MSAGIALRASLGLALFLVLACASTAVLAQKPSQKGSTVDLFDSRALPKPSSGDPVAGMRPGTVGAVAYFSVSPALRSHFRSARTVPKIMRIALPEGGQVTCAFHAESRPGGMLVLTGTIVSDNAMHRCDLVAQDGRITGDIDIASGRYRIEPAGTGGGHAVMKINSAGFPEERSARPPG